MEDIAKVTGKSTAEILDYYNSLSYAEQKGFDLVSVADYIDAERTDVELGRIG
jgi:hypothetical protein